MPARTEVAHDGPSALRIAERFHPDVAVLDIGLPVMDGYELAERLCAQGAPARLVAVTGYGQPADRERGARGGFERHLVKPPPAPRRATGSADHGDQITSALLDFLRAACAERPVLLVLEDLAQPIPGQQRPLAQDVTGEVAAPQPQQLGQQVL